MPIIIVASISHTTKSDEEELDALQAKIDNRFQSGGKRDQVKGHFLKN